MTLRKHGTVSRHRTVRRQGYGGGEVQSHGQQLDIERHGIPASPQTCGKSFAHTDNGRTLAKLNALRTPNANFHTLSAGPRVPRKKVTSRLYKHPSNFVGRYPAVNTSESLTHEPRINATLHITIARAHRPPQRVTRCSFSKTSAHGNGRRNCVWVLKSPRAADTLEKARKGRVPDIQLGVCANSVGKSYDRGVAFDRLTPDPSTANVYLRRT